MIAKPKVKVGIAQIYVCGSLHSELTAIYAIPGDWASTLIKWCANVDAAFAAIVANGFIIEREING